MGKFLVEACVDSVDSALIASEAGANRLELCSNLLIGGTTPTLAMFREIRKKTNIPIHVLIRPRFGDFLYTESEFSVIKEEVRQFVAESTEGVVVGFLRKDGSIDADRLKEVLLLCSSVKVTFHRAFDVCKDPLEGLKTLMELGVDSVLTSGQEDSVIHGLKLLKRLNEVSEGRLSLMAGSGVSPEVIPQIYKETGISQFHLSGKRVLESEMDYRKENVHMGLSSFSEYEIFRTDFYTIREAVSVLKSLNND